MTDGPMLWYLNRATGTVLMTLLTATVVLGLLSTVGRAGRGVPRFMVHALHRNLSLLGVALLIAHVGAAVLDTFVDIRWWQALVPWGGSYRPFWLALGALALDLVVVVTLTSLVRTRLTHRAWRATHLLAYAAWAVGLLHGWGIGTDSSAPWSRTLTLGCVAAVAVAAVVRLGPLVVPRRAGGAR